ncbi:MAG: 3-oxoadipate enol-lactonase [Betaproteobacteria bacterium]
MAFIDIAGAPFHYRIDGKTGAPALLLSNSLGTDLSMWEPQMPELMRSFRVIRYDARGHGRSAVTPGPYTIEQLSRDVLGLLDCIGIERAHFCGLSMGGMTGMWLATHAGYRIDRLVLANTAARIPPAELWNARIEKVNRGGMGVIAQAILERWFTPAFLESRPPEVATTRAMLEHIPAAGYVAACAAVRDMDQRNAIASIACPTLVITGTLDAATPPADGRFIADRIAGARYVELPAGHLSNLEAAPQFSAAVLDFLQP